MASLPLSKTVPGRDRRVINGGLGGCVQIGGQRTGENTIKPTWPLRRKRRPDAIGTSLDDQDFSLSTMTPTSVVLHDMAIYEEPYSLITDNMDSMQIDKDFKELPSPIEYQDLIEYNDKEERSAVFVTRPQTPPTSEQTIPSPVELPGSILLPSQGFPQRNPPVAPARNHSRNSSSENSRRGSTPSLYSASSLYSSSTTDLEMDILKHLKSPSKRSVRANSFLTMSSNQPGKPFTAMTAEELMECLPDLNTSVVSQLWIPAMDSQLQKIKGLLQEAAEGRPQPQPELGEFGNDVSAIAVSARDISRTYFDAMQRVRPLADRDAKAVNDQLEFTQAELQTALDVVEENKNIISDKDNLIQQLHETITTNCRTFGGFIQDHLGSNLNDLHDARTPEIKQLIEDQKNSPGSGMVMPDAYVRISEKDYNSLAERLRSTQQKFEAYSKIAKDQLEIIKSQSADLDKRLDEYGNFRIVLEKRQNQIVELEAKIEANKKDVQEARENTDAFNALKVGQQDLLKKYSDLEWTLQSTKNGFQKQLQDKDSEIFGLRQQLGDAVMEVAAQKTEAKSAISQPVPTSASSWFKNPLHLGRNSGIQERDLPIHTRRAILGGKLPASQSMLSLNTSQANSGQEIHPAFRNTPSPLSDNTRPSGESSSDRSSGGWLGGLSGLRMHPPDTAISHSSSHYPAIQPRKESLRLSGYTPKLSARPASTQMDREKALPKPPPFEPKTSPLHNDSHIGSEDFPPVPPHKTTPTTATIPGKRILSGITELSYEDRNSTGTESPPDTAKRCSPQRSPSSSSDQDAIRSSIAIWDQIRFDDTVEADHQEQHQQIETTAAAQPSSELIPAATGTSTSFASPAAPPLPPPPFSAPIPGSRYYPSSGSTSQLHQQYRQQQRQPLPPRLEALSPSGPPMSARDMYHHQHHQHHRQTHSRSHTQNENPPPNFNRVDDANQSSKVKKAERKARAAEYEYGIGDGWAGSTGQFH